MSVWQSLLSDQEFQQATNSPVNLLCNHFLVSLASALPQVLGALEVMGLALPREPYW